MADLRLVSKATMLIFDRPRIPSTSHNFVPITQWDLYLKDRQTDS